MFSIYLGYKYVVLKVNGMKVYNHKTKGNQIMYNFVVLYFLFINYKFCFLIFMLVCKYNF